MEPQEAAAAAAATAAAEAETHVGGHGSFFKSGATAVDVKGLGVEATETDDVVAVAPTPIGRLAGGAS